MALFAAAHAHERGGRASLNAVALVLALAALALALAPGLVPWIAGHSTNPYTVGIEKTAIAHRARDPGAARRAGAMGPGAAALAAHRPARTT